MAGTVDQRIDIADVLETTAVNGEIRCKLGDSRDGGGYAVNAPFWGMDGFISRPHNPSSAGAVQALYIIDANTKRIIATRDNRFAVQVGAMDPGDRAIVTDGDARIFLKQKSDAIVLYTVDQTKDESMLIRMSGKDGSITMTCGGCFIEMKGGKLTMGAAGGASVITIDDKGVQIDGAQFRCATRGGHLGVLAPQIPPNPAVNNITMGPVGATAVGSASWTVTP